MKTIAQFVHDGIASTDDLKAALQTAMQLEFSTIPPYLCAEWSIDFNNDPDDVMTMIHGIVIQEMCLDDLDHTRGHRRRHSARSTGEQQVSGAHILNRAHKVERFHRLPDQLL